MQGQVQFTIEENSHIHFLLRRMDRGQCIIFNGGGVYAFASVNHEGLMHIARAKQRNMLERPPVIACMWSEIYDLIDWDVIKEGVPKGKGIELFRLIHEALPAVLIYPVQGHLAKQRVRESLNESWTDKIVWKNEQHYTLAVDTMAYPAVHRLVEVASVAYDKPLLYITSANLPGDPTIDNPVEVMQTFPGIPVLEDPFIDSIVYHQRKHGYRGWSSYTSIDVTGLPERILRVVRIGSLAPAVLQQFCDEILGPNVLHVDAKSVQRTLTTLPPYNDLPAMHAFFSYIRTRLPAFTY